MKRNLRFVTLIAGIKPEHLNKDVGRIPRGVHESGGYEAELVTTRERDIQEHREGIGELPVRSLDPTGRIGSLERCFLTFLWKHAKRIDILHLMEFKRINFFYGLLYKLRNPKGLLYLKADIYNHRLEERTVLQTRKPWKKKAIEQLERSFMKRLDLISLENRDAPKIFERVYPEHAPKCIHLPNGIDGEFLEREFPEPTPWKEKKNRFLVVGRIGIPFKNHDLILRALERIDLKDWDVRFIGPTQAAFEAEKEAFFERNPDKRDQVSFLDPIHGRKELYEEHRKAKVQLIPSKLESFGHVILEGGAFDQYIIGSDGILPFDEITRNGEFGTKVDTASSDDLAAKMEEIIAEPDRYRIPTGAFRERILEHFTWKQAVETLLEALEERRGKAQR